MFLCKTITFIRTYINIICEFNNTSTNNNKLVEYEFLESMSF